MSSVIAIDECPSMSATALMCTRAVLAAKVQGWKAAAGSSS
jgi:hypothetical protein